MQHQVIHIHPEAPAKPALGVPCNGCGVCCLAEPCPVGVIVSRRRHGACKALVWSDEVGCYRCGLLAVSPGERGSWWRRWARALWLRWARRMISAGSGCDASLDIVAAPGRSDSEAP
ncbi:MAG: hypothetical protein EKK47_02715 [Burkholderiales bacterium]|nr:MAG: hypothetical protein EKK47_02715 [Burkholderiales bacterium]